MNISQPVREAWRINDGMNKVLEQHLTPDLLTVQTPDKNWSVAGYLAHRAEARSGRERISIKK